MAHSIILSIIASKQHVMDVQMKRTYSSWGSRKNWERKYIPLVLLHNHFLFLSFLRPDYKVSLMICNYEVCVMGELCIQPSTCKTARKSFRANI